MSNRIAILIYVLALISLFFLLDANIDTLSPWARWILFFPLSVLLFILRSARVQQDYQILIVLLFGFPALLLYWAYLLSLFSGERFRRNGEQTKTPPRAAE